MFESEPIDHRKKWELSRDSGIEIVGAMEDALKSKNPDAVKEILSDPGKIRRLILDRSEKGKGLIEIKNGLDFLFMEKFGKEADIFSIESDEILNWMREAGLPEIFLAEMTSIAYHLKDSRKFFRWVTIISENEEKLSDKTVMLKALHDLATWESIAEKNPAKAWQGNNSILSKVRELGDKILETKILFGKTYNNVKISPREKAGDYEKYIEEFRKHGDDYDAIQAVNEAANMYLALSKRQKSAQDKGWRAENLEKAEKLALEALEEASQLVYSNAILKSHRILSQIYEEKGEKKEAQFHSREANRFKRDTGYRY